MLDIFNSDAFSFIEMTDTINKVPFVPGQAGRAVSWNDRGVTTTSIAIEEKAGTLHLVNPSSRGGPGYTIDKDKATLRRLSIPHYELQDGINADEVQGVREFGTMDTRKTIETLRNQRLQELVMWNMDPTLEYQRIGALKGIILNADGSTLYNLFTEFGVSAPSDIPFVLSPSASSGAVRTQCNRVLDAMADEMGAIPVGRVKAFVGKDFWDALIASKEVRETYLNWQAAESLRAGTPYGSVFVFGDIAWERYRGQVDVNGSPVKFIADNEARFFMDSPGLYRTVYAPGDWLETVNTVGLPRYAKATPFTNGKGLNLEVQMNALSYCLRPRTLIKGTFTLS